MSGLIERLSGLVLRDPWLLWLLLLLPLLIGWRARGRPRTLLFAPAALWSARPSWRTRLLGVPAALQVLGLVLLVIALARPAVREELPVEAEGIDILLCLDTSSSMTTTDMDRRRSRLDVARDAATQFIAGRPDDRIGLVGFARYADLRCPLTLDHRALTQILAELRPVASDGPEDATGLGAAVARAAEVLQESRAPSRVVILLTDGEENVALQGAGQQIAPIHAAQLCERLGVRVYAIVAGIGRRDAAGSWVELDTRPVERLAARTGGTFHRARAAGAVGAVYDRIDRLERSPLAEPRHVLRDRYLAFLVAALVLLLLGRLLGATWLDVRP